MDIANEVRGEVDIELDGQSFVLRPSYGAIVSIEKQTGKPLIELASLADVSALPLNDLAICVTEMVRAWGRQAVVDDLTPAAERGAISAASGASKEAIGELIYSAGVMFAYPRVAIALARAASGGCLPSGEPKAAGMTTDETPAAD